MSLTLEQVLARSMRMSRKRPPRSTIFSPLETRLSGGASSKGPASLSQSMPAPRSDDDDIIGGGSPRLKGEYLRPAVGGLLVKNSHDLLTSLQTVKRMGDWITAIECFQQATAVVNITPNVAHIHTLLDTLIDAEQHEIVERFADQIVASHASPGPVFDARGSGGVLEYIAEKYAVKRGPVAALSFVERHRNLVSAAAFASCVRACEKDMQWERAIMIVSSMRDNVLVSCAKDYYGPAPDAVCYASLMAVIEQSGRTAMASELLSKLPGPEKEAITASYAALVHVWAERVSRRKRL
jgi:hypothetical protein